MSETQPKAGALQVVQHFGEDDLGPVWLKRQLFDIHKYRAAVSVLSSGHMSGDTVGWIAIFALLGLAQNRDDVFPDEVKYLLYQLAVRADDTARGGLVLRPTRTHGLFLPEKKSLLKPEREVRLLYCSALVLFLFSHFKVGEDERPPKGDYWTHHHKAKRAAQHFVQGRCTKCGGKKPDTCLHGYLEPWTKVIKQLAALFGIKNHTERG